MRLLNSGTLNEGRNLYHLTVDGFRDELQLSAKNTSRKALRRIRWVKEFYLVRGNEYHSISVFDLLKFHQFGSTALPETLSEYVWYAGGEVWKGTLMAADREQVDKTRRVRIPQRKAQREGDDLAQIGDNSQNRRWTFEIYWRRPGSENIHLDTVSSKFEEKFKKTFLENQTGFHQPTKQEVIAHQHKLYRDQCYPHQKLLRKIFGKTCHELLQQADLRRLLQEKQVARMVPGLPTTSSSSSSTSPTMTSSTVSSDSVVR